jgi:hypothetical protein
LRTVEGLVLSRLVEPVVRARRVVLYSCPDVRPSAAWLLLHTADHALYRLLDKHHTFVFVSEKSYLFANGRLA